MIQNDNECLFKNYQNAHPYSKIYVDIMWVVDRGASTGRDTALLVKCVKYYLNYKTRTRTRRNPVVSPTPIQKKSNN